MDIKREGTVEGQVGKRHNADSEELDASGAP